MKQTPLHEQEWVRALIARETPFTADYASERKEADGRGATYGPDVITRLRNCSHLTLQVVGHDEGDSGHKHKLYRLSLKQKTLCPGGVND